MCATRSATCAASSSPRRRTRRRPEARLSREQLCDAVLAWYDRAGRDLPWRRTSDPYAILVSEVMAQQTQVARVVPYYERWMARWPTAAALADAAPAEALRAWVGLGHNVRALRLLAACRVVVGDGWPRDAAGLQELPGVGRYTAAAVASFAFGERIAAVDTNVHRVARRIGDEPWELLPARRHADWNQAAMELGATVCTARAPRCSSCPAAPWCDSAGDPTPPPPAAGRAAERFEDSDRWVRGRVVAALAAGEDLPLGIEPARLERALRGLERDGLVQRSGRGVGLPSAPR